MEQVLLRLQPAVFTTALAICISMGNEMSASEMSFSPRFERTIHQIVDGKLVPESFALSETDVDRLIDELTRDADLVSVMRDYSARFRKSIGENNDQEDILIHGIYIKKFRGVLEEKGVEYRSFAEDLAEEMFQRIESGRIGDVQ